MFFSHTVIIFWIVQAHFSQLQSGDTVKSLCPLMYHPLHFCNGSRMWFGGTSTYQPTVRTHTTVGAENPADYLSITGLALSLPLSSTSHSGGAVLQLWQLMDLETLDCH